MHHGHDLVWRAASYIHGVVVVVVFYQLQHIVTPPPAPKKQNKTQQNFEEFKSRPTVRQVTTLLSGQQLLCRWEAY